eukprot:XP_011608090.1 PREDICTED: uncharacterized protein LOC101073303 [Takifugu rubripes]
MSLLHLLFVVSAASAWSSRYQSYYRFTGGSLTFIPKYSDGKYGVEFRDKQSTTYCNKNAYTCSLGNCGAQKVYRVAHIASNSYRLNWCQQETLTKRALGTNLPFEIRYPIYISSRYGQGYWISNIRSTMAYWRMMAHVDLGIRSDTGESNRSPVITMMPVLRVTRNCQRTFNLLTFDPDGDHVRCRVATNKARYECGLCGLLGGFTLNQTSCSLTHTFRSYGFHPFELMVEDFPKSRISLSYSDGSYTYKHPHSVGRQKRQIVLKSNNSSTLLNVTYTIRNTTNLPNATTAYNTTTAAPRIYRTTIPPLSRLPLQFSIHVDSHSAPSCLEGDYFPIFLEPTPRHGVNLPAFVNQTLKITVRARAQNTRIVNLIFTGPTGILKQKISVEEYVIKWTPTQNEINGHFPICFVYEALDGRSQVYQSDLRCVVADVVRHEAVVTCNETTIKVEVEKTSIIRQHENNLHLNNVGDSSCNLTRLSNATHLVAVMALNACGTMVEEDEDHVIFMNDITSADPSLIISRQHDVDIAFSCAFPKQTNLTLGFRHKNPYAFSERGFGAFTFQFEFYESHRFRQSMNSSRYPVDVYLKQMMFMQIESTSSIPNTELFVESCKATPYDNPNSRIAYTIIENGCVKDNTVQIYQSSRSQFRFGMEAFEFIGAYQEVYITCSVILCMANTTGTRCSQGCISKGNSRGRREAVDQTSRHSISQGPLNLVVPSDNKGSGLSPTLGLNIIFIVGCVLLCAVVIYRSRRSKTAKYKLLSTSEVN